MKQVFLSGQGEVLVLDAPIPGRLRGSVLVRHRYSLISSGTEGAAVTRRKGLMGLYEKALSSGDRLQQVWSLVQSQGPSQTFEIVRNKLSDFTPLGYSSVGTVVEVDGESMPFEPGDIVACMGAGFASHAEFATVPRNLVAKVPAGVAEEQAAFAALACIAMQGIRRLDLTPGERVGVIGLGLIGQIAVRLLVGMGFRAYGIDLSSERVALAASGGSVEGWVLGETDVVARANEVTAGLGLDGVVICAATDSDDPVNLAFDLCRKSGRVSIVGDVGLGLERAKMYAKELELRMSCSYGPGRYDDRYELQGDDYPLDHVRWSEGRNLEHFLWMLQQGTVDLKDLVTHRFEIDDAPRAYSEIKSGRPSTLGVLLDYGAGPDLEAAREKVRSERKIVAGAPAVIGSAGEGPVRLGIIGAGGYVKGMHLPQLRRLSSEFDVRAIVSRSGASAAAAGRRFGIPVVGSDHREILDSPEVEAVLIATRHASHARFVLEALEAGKHVFVEKPMCVTVEEGDAIVEAAERTGLVVRVGFNRRFSPWMAEFRKALGTSGARMVSMRVNVGPLGKDWSNTDEEGGRLLGEGVHFFDLANWLIGDAPEGVLSAHAGPAEAMNPNASVVLRYRDGSVCSILYTTLGNKASGKEYFEGFGNGHSLRLDDFRSLHVDGKSLRPGARRGDKGQNECLSEFARSIRGLLEGDAEGADARSGLFATSIWEEAMRAYGRYQVEGRGRG